MNDLATKLIYEALVGEQSLRQLNGLDSQGYSPLSPTLSK